MKILLAVSGGIDSMYLANRAPELFPGASFAVAHCNFGLRGDESDGDEAFVREWCGSHGIGLYATRFDTTAYAEERHISIEMAARELRYSWFADICAGNGFDALATAHNANDNAETLMLNLLRGTGSRGIRGMAADSLQGCRILRPMLGITRTEIESWMLAGGHAWRDDSSNAQSEYKRNKIRNGVFPLFKEINPSFVQTFTADMERFAQVDDIAEDYFRESLAKGVFIEPEAAVSVPVLLSLKHWKYVLWRLLENCSLNRQTFDKLTGLLQKYKDGPSGTVTLSGKSFETPSHVIKAVGKELRILPNPNL